MELIIPQCSRINVRMTILKLDDLTLHFFISICTKPIGSNVIVYLTLQLRKMLDLLVHASQCRSPHCQYPNCRKVKGLFRHGIQCKTRASGGCVLCKKMWYLLQLHARACKESECHVPRCRFMHQPYLKIFNFVGVILYYKFSYMHAFFQGLERTFEETSAAV